MFYYVLIVALVKEFVIVFLEFARIFNKFQIFQLKLKFFFKFIIFNLFLFSVVMQDFKVQIALKHIFSVQIIVMVI